MINKEENMIKVSDYIIEHLANKYGIKHIFMISGGGAMHLNDSVGKCKKIKYICNHHEQACAVGAEGYSRVTNKLAVCIVTSGPGGTNTLTGVIGQWLDSVPVLYISGQVKFETTIESCREIGLRQFGDQEINITDMVRPVTKYVKFVKDPLDIKRMLDKAIYLSTHGRPGPVWLDIPLNVQGSLIDEKKLKEYNKKEDLFKTEGNLDGKIKKVVKLLKESKRPVFIAGQGIRISGGKKIFLKLVEKLNIPVVTTFCGFDLIPSSHPLFIGRIGTLGDRAGNFALQNSDLVLSVGSRNNIRQVSYNWQSFARAAKKVIVDIDKAELKKPTIKPDIPVNVDASDFMEKLRSRITKTNLPKYNDWVEWCLIRKNKYDVVLPEYKKVKNAVQPYYFIRVLTENLRENSIVVSANGSACVTLFQAGVVKNGQRMFWNSGCASMGFDLPFSIGACFASGQKDIICIAGDGSIQMNIQELQTIIHYKLPIKIFYLDNEGYISMKQTQNSFFGGRLVACDKDSGVSFPDIIKVGKAYGFKTVTISNHSGLDKKIRKILSDKGPLICKVKLLGNYIFSPKLSSEKLPDGKMVSKPLEDLFPFLNRDEFKSNMII
ncbi:MAG: thiamine pyrophosphate-binding protein [Candidatus Firestonebacteria bacterium]